MLLSQKAITAFQFHFLLHKSSALGVNDISPVKIAAAQTLNEHLRRRGVGRKGDLILVTQAFYLIYIIKAAGIGRIAEKQHKVYLVISNPRTYLLSAALVGMQVKRYGKARRFGHELARRVRCAD